MGQREIQIGKHFNTLEGRGKVGPAESNPNKFTNEGKP